MATPTPTPCLAASSPFDQALLRFKAELPDDDISTFSFTTAEDLKKAILKLQEKQASEKRIQNLNRLTAFVEAMDQFDKVIQVFLNASDYLGFVWGPAKFILVVASSHAEALNVLLEAYQEIGEHMPLLAQYESLLVSNVYLQQVLGFIYTDILEFHLKAVKHFRQKAWKQLIHAVWKTFRSSIDGILFKLQSHRRLLNSQTVLVGVQETLRAIDELLETRRAIEDRCKNTEVADAEKRRREAAAWLSAADSTADHDDALSVFENDPGSGSWLFRQNLVEKWLDPQSLVDPLLWINGKPGAGKTILASVLIERCRHTPGSPVVYFYCKHADPDRNNFVAFARSIILQFSELIPSLPPFILEKASSSDILKSPKVAKEILNVAVESLGGLFMIIDGIDECSKTAKEEISSWVRSATSPNQQNFSGGFRCCFLSQEDNDTGRLFRALPTFKIEVQHNNEDILRFCHLRADEIGTTFKLQPGDIRGLAETVCQKADGMFLYAKLVMENLSNQVCTADVKNEMGEIPPDLNQVYYRIKYRILDESSPPDRRVAKKLLSWMLCAKRTLRWHEVQGAMCLDLDESSFDSERRLAKDLKHFCGSLVDVRHGGTIAFVHLTARLFLQDDPALPRQLEELNITRLCFLQLTLNSHDSDVTRDSIRQFVLDGEYAFTEYALIHAFDHLHDTCLKLKMESGPDYMTLCTTLSRFVAKRVNAPAKRAPALKSIDDSLALLKNEPFFHSLRHAVAYVEALLKRVCKNVNDEPVMMLGSQLAIVRTVMENMTRVPDIRTTLELIYGSNLFKCSQAHCESFHSGFPTEQTRDNHRRKHERVFFCSFFGCQSSIIGFHSMVDLQKHEKDYHQGVQDGLVFPWHGTLESLKIDEEIKKGNFSAFEFWITQWEGEIPIREISNWFSYGSKSNPLVQVCQSGQQKMQEQILEKINAESFPDRFARVCTFEALKVHDENATGAILDHFTRLGDANIYSLLSKSLSLGLDAASMKLLGHPSSPLLNPNKKKRHAAYLNLAIRYGRQAVFRHLLSVYQISPSTQDDKGRISILAAAEFDQVEIALYLVEALRCNKRESSSRGETAITMAGRQGHEDFITSVFRDELQDPHVRMWLNRAQLRNAVRNGDVRRVTELFNAGVDAESIDSQKHSPWLWAVKGGHKKIVEIFLDRYEKQKIVLGMQYPYQKSSFERGKNGPGVLHYAAFSGYDSVVKLLLQSSRFDHEIERRCASFGKGPSGRKVGGKPVEIAESCNHQDIVEMIREYTNLLNVRKAEELSTSRQSSWQQPNPQQQPAAPANQPPQVPAQPPMDPNANAPFGDLRNDSNGTFNLDFGSMDSGDVLENFDFDIFLHTDDPGSDAFTFDQAFLSDGVEADAL